MRPLSLFIPWILYTAAAHAQSVCGAWSAVPVFYGTVSMSSSTSTSAGFTNQKYSAAWTMPLSGDCAWTTSAPGGSATDHVSINDALGISCPQYLYQGAGSGKSPSGQLTIGSSTYQFPVQETITGSIIYSFCGVPPITNKGPLDIGWNGSAINSFSLPSSGTALSGTSNFTAVANDTKLSANWSLTWTFSGNPDDTRCQACEANDRPAAGSILRAENQSLGEDLHVAGTPFYLHYQSDRQSARAGADAVAVSDAISLGGWTLSIHHALEGLLLQYCAGGTCTPYSTEPKALYLGDGSMRSDAEVQAPLQLNGSIYITSEDGSEAYVFTNGQHVQTVRPLTGAVLYTFAYDAAGQLIKITDANASVTTIQRDSSEHPTAIISPFGQQTLLSVDASGMLNQFTDPAGHATRFTYLTGGLLSSLTDPNGNLYNYNYDAYGRLISHHDPAAGSTSLARTNTSSGYSVTAASAMGRTSTYATSFSSNASSTTQTTTSQGPDGLTSTTVDSQQNGQVTSNVTLPDGTSVSRTSGPDPLWGMQVPVAASTVITTGNLTMDITRSRTARVSTAGNPFTLTSLTDKKTVNGNSYTSTYTASKKQWVSTTPVGRQMTLTLDSQERVSSTQVSGLTAKTVAYDAQGRLSSVSRGARKSTFTYNAAGGLATITDPLHKVRSFTYDAAGRMNSMTLPDGRIVNYTYDADGNLTLITPPGKSGHAMSFDPVNGMSSYTPPAVSGTGSTLFTYNPDHQISSITRPDGQVINYAYDSAGRDSVVSTPAGTITFTYDAATGNLASASTSNGESLTYTSAGMLPSGSTWSGVVNGSIARTFDNNYRVTALTVGTQSAIALEYDNDGLLTGAGALTITRNNTNGLITATTLGVITDTMTYDAFGELTAYTADASGSVLYSATLTPDNLGRVTQKVETIGGATNTYTYKYDAAGRLTNVSDNGASQATYAYDTNSNRISRTTATGATRATYDAQDRMLTYGGSSYTYSANGELASQTASKQTTSYTYDVWGNLTAATLPGGTQISYVVDAQNRRVGKKVNGILTAGYLYDGSQLVAQLNGGNAVISEFVYGTRPNTPDYMINNGITYRIISDQQGSPRIVVNSATGQIIQQISYDEFGNITSDTNPGFQPFGFAGGLYDQDTKLVRFGARDYSPAMGRWTAKDPALFTGGTNLYGYALNDPVNQVDTNGLWSISISGYIGVGGGLSIAHSDGHWSWGYELGVGDSFGVDWNPNGTAIQGDPWWTSQATLFAQVQAKAGRYRASIQAESKERADCPGTFGDWTTKEKACIGPVCYSNDGWTGRIDPTKGVAGNLDESGVKNQIKAGVKVVMPLF